MNHRMHIQTLLGVVPPWEPEWVNDAYKIHGWAPKRPSVGEHLARMQWEVQYGAAKYDPIDGQPWCSGCNATTATSLLYSNSDTSRWWCPPCLVGGWAEDDDETDGEGDDAYDDE